MSGLVLFGIGSPICADVVESCRRNAIEILAGIRNVPGATYGCDGVRVMDAAALADGILDHPFLLPMFKPASRRTALAAALGLGFHRPASLADRTAIIAASAVIEEGAYINAGCILAGKAVLRRFAFCNRAANIGHDCRIGAFASLGPGAILSGSVSIGEDALIGAGAVILPEVTIGAGAIVAPGAVVGRDVPAAGFAAGNPARVLSRPAAGA